MKMKRQFYEIGLCLAGAVSLAWQAHAAPESKNDRQNPAAQERPTVAPGDSAHARRHEPGEDARGEEKHEGRENRNSDARQDRTKPHGPRETGESSLPPGSASAPLSAASGPASPSDEERRHHRDNAAESDQRRERRSAQLRELRSRWGDDALKRPEVRDELREHAWRLARLKRLRELAAEKKNEKLLSRIERLEQKENERHTQAMGHQKLIAGRPTPNASGAPSAQGAPESESSARAHHRPHPAASVSTTAGGQP